MIVRTLERQFAVLQVLRETEEDEISLCRDLEENQLYTLARFRNPNISRCILPALTQQRDNGAFTDYLGVFSQGGDLYARFRYTQAPTLAQRLASGEWGFGERLEVAGALLERMALLNMPPFLQYEALREGNITVDDALRLRFNYVLEPMSICFQVDMGLICIRVEELLRDLFAPELAAKALPELETYLLELRNKGVGNYVALYGSYDQLRTLLRARMLVGAVEPQTWLFRLWKKIKGWARFVRPILGGLVLVAALCYLVYTLLLPAVPRGTPVRFDQVGAVEIQSSENKTP